MLIDIHIHTKEYSSCSDIDLEEAIVKAKSIGLDGICITDHESKDIADKAMELSKKHDFLIIVGVEILTYEGDLLVFGLEEVPKEKMSANELISLVSRAGGIAISAHPYRDNGRGMGDNIRKLDGLSGIEVFNGNTELFQNIKAFDLAKELNLPCLGGSDAHRLERIGRFATLFPDGIRDEKDLIDAIKHRKVSPVKYVDINDFQEIKYLKEARI